MDKEIYNLGSLVLFNILINNQDVFNIVLKSILGENDVLNIKVVWASASRL